MYTKGRNIQLEIVRRVEAGFALPRQIEVRFTRARALAWPAVAERSRLDILIPSLLARAFAGKLVPQDPTDEPAKELLERIQRKGRGHA